MRVNPSNLANSREIDLNEFYFNSSQNMISNNTICLKHACGDYGFTCDLSQCTGCHNQTPSGACQLCVSCARERQECRYCRRSLQFNRIAILADLDDHEREVSQWRTLLPNNSVLEKHLDDKIKLIRQVKAEVDCQKFDNVEAVIRRYQELENLQEERKQSVPAPAQPTKPVTPEKPKGWLSSLRSWFRKTT